MSRTPEDGRDPIAGWRPCPDGEIGRLSRRLKARRSVGDRRRFLAGAAGMAFLGGAALVWTGIASTHRGRERRMSCSEALSRLPEYARGGLDRSTRERIEAHLGRCASCRHEFGRHDRLG